MIHNSTIYFSKSYGPSKKLIERYLNELNYRLLLPLMRALYV